MRDSILTKLVRGNARQDYSHLPPALRDEVLSAMEATSLTDIR